MSFFGIHQGMIIHSMPIKAVFPFEIYTHNTYNYYLVLFCSQPKTITVILLLKFSKKRHSLSSVSVLRGHSVFFIPATTAKVERLKKIKRVTVAMVIG